MGWAEGMKTREKQTEEAEVEDKGKEQTEEGKKVEADAFFSVSGFSACSSTPSPHLLPAPSTPLYLVRNFCILPSAPLASPPLPAFPFFFHLLFNFCFSGGADGKGRG